MEEKKEVKNYAILEKANPRDSKMVSVSQRGVPEGGERNKQVGHRTFLGQ